MVEGDEVLHWRTLKEEKKWMVRWMVTLRLRLWWPIGCLQPEMAVLSLRKKCCATVSSITDCCTHDNSSALFSSQSQKINVSWSWSWSTPSPCAFWDWELTKVTPPTTTTTSPMTRHLGFQEHCATCRAAFKMQRSVWAIKLQRTQSCHERFHASIKKHQRQQQKAVHGLVLVFTIRHERQKWVMGTTLCLCSCAYVFWTSLEPPMMFKISQYVFIYSQIKKIYTIKHYHCLSESIQDRFQIIHD